MPLNVRRPPAGFAKAKVKKDRVAEPSMLVDDSLSARVVPGAPVVGGEGAVVITRDDAGDGAILKVRRYNQRIISSDLSTV